MAYTNLRLLYLLDIFRQETDEAHRLTVPQLVDALAERDIAAERKSIYRDIQALIAYGADIRKSAAGYYLEGRAFLPGEVRILAEALRAAPFLTRRRTEDLTNRLGLFLSRHQAQSALTPGLGAPKAQNDEALRSLEALQAAIVAAAKSPLPIGRARVRAASRPTALGPAPMRLSWPRAAAASCAASKARKACRSCPWNASQPCGGTPRPGGPSRRRAPI